MSEALGGDQEDVCTVSVPVTGLNRPVPVLIAHDSKKLPEGLTVLAPDTRQARVFASIDRGANAYGSIREEFFVCRDSDFDYNWTVLWVTQNAEQAQDNVQRLEPFSMLGAGWPPDEIEDNVASLLEDFDPAIVEGMILLWAYAHYAAASWGEEFHTDAKVRGGLLDASAAGLVVQAGTVGSPLNLSWLSQQGG
jgi:hypothetical protein